MIGMVRLIWRISAEQIAQFSQRSQQIEAELAKNGLSRETASHEQKCGRAENS